MAHEVFVSYSTADEAVAEALRLQLEATHEISCWMAPSDIPSSAAWDETSIEALDKSRVLVLVQGSTDRTSLRVDRDVQRALKQGIKVIPFRAEDAAATEGLDLRIGSLAESVKALLAQRSADKATAMARDSDDQSTEPEAGGGCLRLAGIVIGSAFLLAALLIVGLRLRNEGLPRVGAGAPASTSPTGEPAAAAADRSPAFEQAPPPESPIPAVSPEGTGALAGAPAAGTVIAGPASSQAQFDAPPASASPATTVPPPEPDRPSRDSTTIGVGGRTAQAAIPVRPDDGANGVREPGAKLAAQAPAAGATFGTMVVEFTSNLPDGTIEVEVDGVRRWSERLRIDKTPGLFERLKLQRATRVFASELTVPAGEHKVTVTVLNGDGEVQDFGSTTLHVDTARSVTLRVRFSRFRNRLQLESAVG